MSRIEIDGLTKRFGDTVALDDVSFEVPAGEFVIILGVSGSGKSTLLRCMSGLTTPTEGEVRIDGRPMTAPRPEVAMIFQQHNIVGDMTAYSNALSGGINRSGFLESVLQLQDKSEKQQALEALDTVGLLEEAQQKARRMSGGQQQRVGIARALVQEPNVLLADEPVASLDPGSAQDVMQYLKTASKDKGLSTFISLHQVNIARKFGERFIGLQNGKKVFDGYLDELTIDAIDEIYGDIDTEGMFITQDTDRTVADSDQEATP
ncbi:phosphonate ABC transporter ATP-binding protein [Natronocalculus amylovorans]|uniref:Phosphonate ABC transporter ATP-binding protein n=1 Tax=Natronocalculus amylovorans TaxID=2917812 RepID=A0AAE3K702_9EURY|nr:phosphonate ABC transporter ATP-binding protein [Natronocalculus amylovorans]MCL9815757.1 phosphonate ABC transporter ATP-binding protein [Natronocalculus amylovorans]NUE01731.1 phosphonate ABC transporter ATP-binding protein [Halorubraceae archaeon YAN]